MFWGIWCCHMDHSLLESSSWYGFTKFLHSFLRQSWCPKNICTEHWRKLPNLAAFLEIYLHLKPKDNNSVKHMQNVLLNVLFIYFSLLKFAKFLMSFSKAQVTFSSNFASIFIAIKHNTSVLFFSSNIIYYGQRSKLKSICLRFSSGKVKIRQIPHANFEMTSQVLFKLCIILHWHET